jgi:outer membrane protein assembly factor BamB
MMRLVLALLLCRAVLGAADFRMFKGGPERLGRAEESLGAPASLAWQKEAGGAFYSSPAVVSGTVFLGNSDHHVYAYSLADGALRWKSELPERIYGSSPQVEGKLIYIACVNGCVYALDSQSGAVRFRTCIQPSALGSLIPRSPLGLEPPFVKGTDILGSPLVHDGKLYFGSDNHVIYAYDASGGKELWSYQTGDKVHDSAATVAGGLLYMAGTDGRLVALDAASGRLAWKSADYEKLNTTPMAYQGRIYFGAGDNRFHCLDALSGASRWSFEVSKGIMSSPALGQDGQRLVFGCADGEVYCLGLDGSLAWKFQAQGPVLASPLVTGPTVWIGSFGKRFFGINLKDGSEVFSIKTSAGVFSSAAASGGRIVFGDRDGILYCIQASKK